MTTGEAGAHVRCSRETRDRIAALSRADGVTQAETLAALVAAEEGRRAHAATTGRAAAGHTSSEAGAGARPAQDAPRDAVDAAGLLAAELERSREREADLRNLLHEAHAIAQTQALARAKPSLADRIRGLLRRGEDLEDRAGREG